MLDNINYYIYPRPLMHDTVMLMFRIRCTAYPKNAHGIKDVKTGIRIPTAEFIGDQEGFGGRFGPWIRGNDEISLIRNNLIREMMDKMDAIYLKIKTKTKREPFASEILDVYKHGFKERLRKKLLEFIPEYCAGNGIKENTVETYTQNLTGAIKKFLKVKYDATDIYLDEIDTTFIYRFEMYMASALSIRGKPYKKSSIAEYINKLKAVCTYAYKIGEVPKDPTDGYTPTEGLKPDKLKKVVENFKEAITWKISPTDLHKIETVQIAGKAIRGENTVNMGVNQNMYDLTRGRLLFLFQSWTGLSYADLVKYRDIKQCIRYDLTGKKSIMYYRQKTGELAMVLLFPQTEQIMEALDYNVAPMCSYDTYNRQIKALLRYYNVELNEEDKEKEGSTHLPRHLFGSRMLAKGFSMESVSKMLGHSSIEETEKVYARVDLVKIHADFEKNKEYIESATSIAI